MRIQTRLLTVALLLGACDGGAADPPDQADVDLAKQRVALAAESADQARTALELLGVLPTYDCGEPRGTFVEGASSQVVTENACATASFVPGTAADTITIVFPAAGCVVRGHTLAGTMVVTYAGGEDLMDVEADARELVVDGHALHTLAGYGTCGDETSYWVISSGTVPGHPETTFTLDGHVAKRDGVPVIGGTTLILDATGTVTDASGTDDLTLISLEYEMGDMLPKNGTIQILAPPHFYEAVFNTDSPLYGTVRITVDSHDPVTVPIVSL